ncbi:hypothetical protein HXX76_001072 [Chlamydomonas incerta]|uniref:Uncharacterized protein n=1 Tax=Chlamydomonas incerta TaxID=51695 RepID=A0A835WBM1_CHLIN|nr:hypothetical protein HXX76_001072 [Chlamydomonas incerta]|eukprot:KAG2444315.1 hypothetical protein HXX76_001072 [Chlamydomonas incerta]
MGSTDDSGASLPSAPSAVVDSVQAVSLLRRTHLRYRGHHSVHHAAVASSRPAPAIGAAHPGASCGTASFAHPTSAVITAGTGEAAAVSPLLPRQAPRPRCTQLYIKLPGLDPKDVRPGFVAAVNNSLQLHGSSLQVVGAAVRRGCVELTLDLMEREDAAAAVAALLASGNAAAAAAAAADAELSEVLDLPALILSAMGVPQTSGGLLRLPAGTAAYGDAGEHGGASEGEERGGQCVFVQRRGNCWSLEWDPDAMTWAVRDQPVDRLHAPSAPLGAGAPPAPPQVMLHAPLAAHAEEQLAAAAAVAAQQQLAALAGGSEALPGSGSWPKLRLAVAVQGCEAWRFAGYAGAEAAAAAAGAPAAGAAADLSLVAKANGRCVDAQVLSLLRSGGALVLQVELDVALLAAGRPGRSPGLVLRLELWRGAAPPAGAAAPEPESEAAAPPPRMLDAVCVACLREAGPVSELLALQRELAAAGQLDPCDDAFLSGAEQREEAEQLLGDLATWLDFVAALHGSPAAAAAAARAAEAEAEESQRDELDLSGEVAHLLLEPGLQPTLLAAGQHLLEHFVQHGRAELARCVQEQLAAAAERLAAAGGGTAAAVVPALAPPACRGANTAAAPALTLLHRAVRSGSQRMTELVLQWYRDAEAAEPAAADGCAAAGTVWDARAPGGITPLHILAAEARCLPSLADQLSPAAAAPSDPGSPTAAEALLRWIMASFPEAVTVWNTARDAAGNTPAALWAALGGGDMQLLAAATALEQVAAADGAGDAADDGEVAGGLPVPPPAPAPRIPTTGSAQNHATTTGPREQGSTSTAAAAAAEPAAAAVPGGSGAAVAQLLAAPPPLSQLMRLAVRGFPDPAMERSYMHYVTVTARGTTTMWVVIMVLAHVAAFFKSLHTGEARQAVVGGFSYGLTLCVMVLSPHAYVSLREPLMLSCLGGRTVCRTLLWLAPHWLHMSENVVKYVVYGLDILLDGVLEGTFEQARLPRVAVARLVEWFILAQFMHSYGIAGDRLAANLARAALTSGLGLAMSCFMDLRMRGAFLRDSRLAAARAGGGGGAAGAAAGTGAGIAAAFAAGVKAGGAGAAGLKRKAD